MPETQLDFDGGEIPWKEAGGVKTLEPVEIQTTQHHPYVKGKRGCATCGRPKTHPEHLGAPPSFNALGSGNQFAYQALKKGWSEALTLALEGSDLPRGLRGVLVEGVACFPDTRKRDQGNHRVLIEKALGDALQAGGWLVDDDWDSYEFGQLAQTYRKGESWMRLTIFPR